MAQTLQGMRLLLVVNCIDLFFMPEFNTLEFFLDVYTNSFYQISAWLYPKEALWLLQ
jgi:hypothetical protein